MKKILVLLLLVKSLPVFSQVIDNRHFVFEGNFAFELDDRLWSLDDMIFRQSVLIPFSEGKVQCNNSIFVFEESIPDLDISDLNEDEKKKVKNATNWLNDEFRNLFKTKNTKIIRHKGFEYKIFKIKFKCLYLGKLEHFVRKNNKFSKKKISTYLIYDFLQITEN